MKCPTCPDSFNNHCCRCNRIIPPQNQLLRTGPFRNKIYNDQTLHLYCDRCYKERKRVVQQIRPDGATVAS